MRHKGSAARLPSSAPGVARLIFAVARDASALRNLAETIQAVGMGKTKVVQVVADLGTPRGLRAAADRALAAEHGGIDLLVNNAGAGAWKHIEDTTPEEGHSMMSVPYHAAFSLTALLISHLSEREGHVLNITCACCSRCSNPRPKRPMRRLRPLPPCLSLPASAGQLADRSRLIVPALSNDSLSRSRRLPLGFPWRRWLCNCPCGHPQLLAASRSFSQHLSRDVADLNVGVTLLNAAELAGTSYFANKPGRAGSASQKMIPDLFQLLARLGIAVNVDAAACAALDGVQNGWSEVMVPGWLMVPSSLIAAWVPSLFEAIIAIGPAGRRPKALTSS